MATAVTARKRLRKSFGRIAEVTTMPNLIEVQRQSYEGFLQMNVTHEERVQNGLQEVFRSIFPVKDFADRAALDFVKYDLEAPKYDVEECHQRGLTYAAPLRVTLRLIVWDIDEDTGSRSVRDIKEQDVYMGDMPLMTNNGTFVVNGTERVIVSQMHRSPGVFFDHDRGKTHSSGKFLFSARVIPYRGSWLDFEFDAKDHVYVRIDRRRKLPSTSLLLALGLDPEELLATFYDELIIERCGEGWKTGLRDDRMLGQKLVNDLVDASSGETLAEAGTKMTPRLIKKILEKNVKELFLSDEDVIGRFLSRDVINEENGLVIGEAGDELTGEIINQFTEIGMTEIPVLDIDHTTIGPYMRNTLILDKCTNREEALLEIYRVLRPGEPPTLETAETLFSGLFFDAERYDLSPVGRVKMNMRLDLQGDDSLRVLRREDIIAVLRHLVQIKDGRGDIDDIDHLGNRRVRSVGELMENQFRVGLLRMERAVRERMSSVEIDAAMPHDLVNAKPVAAAVREFFGSSQLSQFMDQTNPLAEITHKRRLSALGPGGLTRERAGFEVRDVHPTHYGRICPIETPEGPNIGLINSLATYARINQYGFIESPYRRVVDGKVSEEVIYLSAMEEGRYTIAQANSELNEDRRFANEFVSCREAGEFMLAKPERIDLIDVSPKQLVSVAAALIPFLENDDANRALMGSNMQRQAVPLLRAEAPFVGTGMEEVVARDSGAAVAARRSGVVDQVDGSRIVIRVTDESARADSVVDIFNLRKFQRSNQNTCINQRPLVKVDDVVQAGDIIADGPSTELGELALGRNALVAFMPWNGYNFEDSILISERIVREDIFTSIHIEEFEVMARDTKLGPESITRDIPNVSEEALRNLDEAGIVYIGAEVKAGDILVGKVTPKGETPMTPEEKLLRAIFGEKAADVRDTSLKVPPGVQGTIVEVRVFNRRGVDKDERAIAIERGDIERLAKDRDDERNILQRNLYGRMREMLEGQTATAGPQGITPGTILTADILDEMPRRQWWDMGIDDVDVMTEIQQLKRQLDDGLRHLQERFDTKVEKLQRGDELPPGVLKMVKVFVAVKRKLQPGDKMAGRHGNKGVISKIAPAEDMPHLEDGTPVDIVLNPLGVPSRMNVGQILETHLGWACANLGRQIRDIVNRYQDRGDSGEFIGKVGELFGEDMAKEVSGYEMHEQMELGENLSRGTPIATPVFDGAHEPDIVKLLEDAGCSSSGQVTLVDGRTGESFDRKVTVGYIYMLKLGHLVDDKIHARSVGPYSLVTQQPLGGKAQFGGQRFGEMECWALQAYGASYTLQEMLTVKSDDVSGRTKIYEAIVRGEDTFEAGIPESFNVLVKELQALSLNVELQQDMVGD